MQVLNRYDKEQLVIKMCEEGKTMRDISSAAHMSRCCNRIGSAFFISGTGTNAANSKVAETSTNNIALVYP